MILFTLLAYLAGFGLLSFLVYRRGRIRKYVRNWKYFSLVYRMNNFILVLMLILFWIASLLSYFDSLDKIIFLIAMSTGFFAAYFAKPFNANQDKTSSSNISRLTIFLGLTLLFAFFIIPAINLGNYMTVDEPKWLYNRVPILEKSLVEQDWQKLLINDKPGIVPAFFSSLLIDTGSISNTNVNSEILFWWRLPVLLFVVSTLAYLFYQLIRLFKAKPGLLAFSFIVFQPALLTISGIVNPDSTLWSLSIISTVHYILFLKSGKRYDLFASGLWQTLALLSKFTAGLNYILILVISFVDAIDFKSNSLNPAKLKENLYGFISYTLIGLFLFAILMPYNWFDPAYIARGTVGSVLLQNIYPLILPIIIGIVIFAMLPVSKLNKFAIQFFTLALRGVGLIGLVFFIIAIVNIIGGGLFVEIDIPAISPSNRNMLTIAIKNFHNILTGIPLIVVVGYLIFVVCSTFLPINALIKYRYFGIAWVTSSFFLCFNILLGRMDIIANIRYQIIFLPFLSILAAITLYYLLPKLKYRGFVLAALIVFPVLTTPYLWTFTNTLAINNTSGQDTWGFGGYEIATYLNNLPNAKNIRIWVDREGVGEFFNGTTYWRSTVNPFNESLEIDYLVLTPSGQNTYLKATESQEVPIYYEMAQNTPILDYYKKEPVYSVCTDKGSFNCYHVVEL